MNPNYRSIWNESLGAWVAASENDSARGKPNKSAVAKAVITAVLVRS
ncbi:ESPR domain-containing protein [Burkholderia vietnamiensis]